MLAVKSELDQMRDNVVHANRENLGHVDLAGRIVKCVYL